jgi:hypothetical protein
VIGVEVEVCHMADVGRDKSLYTAGIIFVVLLSCSHCHCRMRTARGYPSSFSFSFSYSGVALCAIYFSKHPHDPHVQMRDSILPTTNISISSSVLCQSRYHSWPMIHGSGI